MNEAVCLMLAQHQLPEVLSYEGILLMLFPSTYANFPLHQDNVWNHVNSKLCIKAPPYKATEQEKEDDRKTKVSHTHMYVYIRTCTYMIMYNSDFYLLCLKNLLNEDA